MTLKPQVTTEVALNNLGLGRGCHKAGKAVCGMQTKSDIRRPENRKNGRPEMLFAQVLLGRPQASQNARMDQAFCRKTICEEG